MRRLRRGIGSLAMGMLCLLFDFFWLVVARGIIGTHFGHSGRCSFSDDARNTRSDLSEKLHRHKWPLVSMWRIWCFFAGGGRSR